MQYDYQQHSRQHPGGVLHSFGAFYSYAVISLLVTMSFDVKVGISRRYLRVKVHANVNQQKQQQQPSLNDDSHQAILPELIDIFDNIAADVKS